jgi:antitoxin CcdA
MKYAPIQARKPVNVSLGEDLVVEAKALGLNLSQACERGLVAEVKRERERRWLEENGEAIKLTNQWVKEHGLPLEKYRVF